MDNASADQPLLPFICGMALVVAVVGGIILADKFPEQRLASHLLRSGSPATATEVQVLIVEREKGPELNRVRVTFEEFNGRIVRAELTGAITEDDDSRPGWHAPAESSRYAAPELGLRFEPDDPTQVMATADAKVRAGQTSTLFISGGMVVAGLATAAYVFVARRPTRPGRGELKPPAAA